MMKEAYVIMSGSLLTTCKFCVASAADNVTYAMIKQCIKQKRIQNCNAFLDYSEHAHLTLVRVGQRSLNETGSVKIHVPSEVRVSKDMYIWRKLRNSPA